MFVHKVSPHWTRGKYLLLYFQSAVKDNDSGKLVKFGYVVFAEKGVAQKVLKEGSIIFQGSKITVKLMSKN